MRHVVCVSAPSPSLLPRVRIDSDDVARSSLNGWSRWNSGRGRRSLFASSLSLLLSAAASVRARFASPHVVHSNAGVAAQPCVPRVVSASPVSLSAATVPGRRRQPSQPPRRTKEQATKTNVTPKADSLVQRNKEKNDTENGKRDIETIEVNQAR